MAISLLCNVGLSRLSPKQGESQGSRRAENSDPQRTPGQWPPSNPLLRLSVMAPATRRLITLSMAVRRNTGNDSGDLGSWDRFVNYTKHDLESGVFLDIMPFIGTQSTEMFVNATISSVNASRRRALRLSPPVRWPPRYGTKDGRPLFWRPQAHRKVKSKNGAPWLSEIPVLGYLFGGETSVDRGEHRARNASIPSPPSGHAKQNGNPRSQWPRS